MGEEWLTFMQKANDIMLWWQMLDWVEEVRRCLLDALGWLEFVMRQLVHHLTLIANFSPPCFVTEGHFVGVIMDSYYQDGVDLAEEIVKLGAPMWVASFAEHNPPLTVIPPGSAAKHPILRCILEAERKNNNPSVHEDSMAMRREFSTWIEDLHVMNRGLATKPLAWFEPAQHPPSELAGPLFVDPDSTASPSLKGI